MKKIILILLLIFTTLTNADELKKISLQLQWKHQFQFAGYYIAKEKGFYKDVGFDLTIKEYDFGLDITNEILQNNSTFGIGRSNLIIDKSNGKDIILLASVFQSSPHILMALKNSSIKSVKNFYNKKIMFTGDAKKDTTIMSMLFSKGLTLNDINIQKHSFDVDDLINKKTDLMSAYISNEPYKLKEKGYESIIFDPKDYGFDFYSDILFTSNDYLKKYPQEVREFTKATLKGWKYAFDNIQETANLILEKYNTQNKSIDALIYEGIELKKLAYYKTNSLGDIDNNKISKIFDYYKLMGLVANKININKFIFQDKKLNINPKLRKILTTKEINWIKNHNVIKVSNESDYAPFNFTVEEVSQGYTIDLLNKLAKYADIKFEYIKGHTWDEFINMFQKKEIDLLHSLTKTPKREKFGNFSLPFIRYKTYIYTTKNNAHIKDIKDLYGKTVVVGKGWSVDNFLTKKYPQIKLLRVNNVEQMLFAVSSGKADALINDKYSILYYTKKYEIDNIIESSWFKQFDNNQLRSYHFLGQKSDPEIISILNKALTLISDEQIDTLKEKWFGKKNTKSLLTLTKKENDYLLEEKKQIKFCIDPAWMPFEAVDKQGNHTGISSDYIKYFSEVLNTKFVVTKTNTWEESLLYVKQRKCDILPLAMQTPKRKEYLNFTNAYLKVPLVIATKINVPFIDNLQLLKNKKVAIPKGYAFIEILEKNYPNLKLVEVQNIDEGLKKVIENKVFGYIGTLAGVGYKFQTKFNGELKIAGKFNEKWELGVGVRNDDPILLSIMEKAIDNLTQKQQQSILNNWISIKYEKGIDYDIVWKTVSPLIAIIFVILFFYFKEQALKKELKYKNKELQIQNDEFETIFNNSKDGVAILDLKSNFLNFNEEYQKMTGLSKDELLKTSCMELSAPEDKERSKEVLEQVKKYGFQKNFEKTYIIKENKHIIVNMSLSLMPDKKRLIISVKDITQLKQLESHKKLASMAEMIGNIAHQWRQPLSVIATSASALQIKKEMNLLTDEEFNTYCNHIEDNTKYLSQTIDNFNNLIKDTKKPILFNIDDYINDFMGLVDKTIKENHIQIFLDINKTTEINGYPNELIQCFINIFDNSKDAFLEKNINKKERFIFIKVEETAKTIIISFKDNAKGINEDILTKIFEPYFTTKHQSQGTGLGLHMTYNIITNHMKGSIEVFNDKYSFKKDSYKGALIKIVLQKV